MILAEYEMKNPIMTAGCEKHGITCAGKGICFCLPVESVAGLHVSADSDKNE